MSNGEKKSQLIVKETKKLYYRVDKKYIIFAVFFLISSVLWFLIALSKEYTTIINIPVRYVGIPKNKALINKPATSLQVEVKAHGFSLLKHYMKFDMTVAVIDVEQMMRSDNLDENNHRYFVSTKYSQKQLLKNVSAEYVVHDIMPDSLIFYFSDIVSKKVKVKPNFTLLFQKQHKQKGDLISKPDSVMVSGPFLLIDTLQEVETEHLEIDDLSTSTSKNVAIATYQNIRVSPSRVKVDIAVEKFTEQIISVPIKMINLPTEYSVSLTQTTAEVRFVIGISDFGTVSDTDFLVEVDCHAISEMPDRLSVKLKHFPSNIELIGFLPKNVEYVLVKN